MPFDEIAPEVPEADIVDAQGKPLHPSSAADMVVNAEVVIPQGGGVRLVKVIRRSGDSDGKVLGDYNNIPMLNTILYGFQFPDGAIDPYSENLIVENILTQLDVDGYHNQLLEGILDHSKDKRSVEKKYQWIFTKCGRRSMRQTNAGWKFRVKLKDGTVTWTYLKNIKK